MAKEKQGWFQRGWNDIKTAGRQGIAELRSFIYPQANVALDPATWGVISPGEAADNRREANGQEKSSRSLHDEYSKQQEPSRSQPERELHEPERE